MKCVVYNKGSLCPVDQEYLDYVNMNCCQLKNQYLHLQKLNNLVIFYKFVSLRAYIEIKFLSGSVNICKLSALCST